MGLCVFSLPISVVMIERIYILCLIIIIKSEVWTITHCLGLGHETMVSAVCLSVFFCDSILTGHCWFGTLSFFLIHIRLFFCLSTSIHPSTHPSSDRPFLHICFAYHLLDCHIFVAGKFDAKRSLRLHCLEALLQAISMYKTRKSWIFVLNFRGRLPFAINAKCG